MTLNLKEALTNNKLKEFIKERDKETGDKTQFDAAISSMASGKSPKAQATSKPRGS
jgi:predicted Zn-dependent protease